MMFQPWQCTLHVAQHQATLLVTNAPHDLLKAQLDSHPSHPRALLTLLENLSLWQGEPQALLQTLRCYRAVCDWSFEF
ncbi:hypothetical protein ACFL5O_05830 [Myxococcota bacterium]